MALWDKKKIAESLQSIRSAITPEWETRERRVQGAFEVEDSVKVLFPHVKTCKCLKNQPLNSDDFQQIFMMNTKRNPDPNYFPILCPSAFTSMLHGNLDAATFARLLTTPPEQMGSSIERVTKNT